MGNCQAAAEAATVAIQHPGGRTQRLYWPTPAEEVMRCNPGHHVALVIASSAHCSSLAQEDQDCGARVRLLKPNHMLLTGLVYRLIPDQEVTKVVNARKHKLRRRRYELIHKQQEVEFIRPDQHGNGLRYQEMNQDGRRQQKRAPASSNARIAGQWQPSLRSIAEDGL